MSLEKYASRQKHDGEIGQKATRLPEFSVISRVLAGHMANHNKVFIS